jgi:hypothetical protein
MADKWVIGENCYGYRGFPARMRQRAVIVGLITARCAFGGEEDAF